MKASTLVLLIGGVAALSFGAGLYLSGRLANANASSWHAQSEQYVIANIEAALSIPTSEGNRVAVDRMLVQHLNELVRIPCTSQSHALRTSRESALRALEVRWRTGPNPNAASGSPQAESNANAAALLRQASLPCA